MSVYEPEAMGWPARVVSILGLLLLALVLMPAPASAQEDGDSSADKRQRAKKAKVAFEKGAALYNEKKYSSAIVEFRRGQRVYPSGLFLYNIAMCHMRLGNMEDAREYALRSLEIDTRPLGPRTRASASGLVAGVDVVTFTGRQSKSIAASDRGVQHETRTAVPGGNNATSPADSKIEAGFGWLGWTGVTGAALGAGVLVATGLIARDIDSDFEMLRTLQTGSDQTAFEAQQAQIADKQRLGRALGITGVVMVAAGSGLVIAEVVGGEPDRRVRLQTNGLNGLSLVLDW
ncbi:MAG: tetratricopeptide repeat protein [Myxococcota bacterium]